MSGNPNAVGLQKKQQLKQDYMLWITEEAYVINSVTGQRERIRIEYPSEMSMDDLRELLQSQTVYRELDGRAENDMPVLRVAQRQHWSAQ